MLGKCVLHGIVKLSMKRKVNNANNTVCQSAMKKAGWGHNCPEQPGLVKRCFDVVGME